MNRIPCLRTGQIERLARLLGECGTGSDITRVLSDQGLVDNASKATKWRRIYSVFRFLQERDMCANNVLALVQSFMDPTRFIGRTEVFEQCREQLNTTLAFSGLTLGADGKLRTQEPVRTLEEAERRLKTIRGKFKGRRLHPQVLKYCEVELMQDNYFHAVFEATKGLAQRIRDMVGIQLDGAALVDQVFLTERPMLAMNSLQSPTEKSEHKGFAALLKGCFGAVRNPLAHGPKILWDR